MKVTQRKLANGHVELTATATADEVEDALNAAHIKFAETMNLKPDPNKIVSQLAFEQLGIRDLDAMVQPQAADSLVPFALDKADVCPALRPVPTSNQQLVRGRGFKFKVDVVPKPEFELSSYEPVRIVMDEFTYDAGNIQDKLDEILAQGAEYPVLRSKRAVKKGDHCYIAINVTIDGEETTGVNSDGRVYSLGHGFMPPAFDEGLVGMAKGDEKTIEFDAPFEGGTSHFVCEVKMLGLRKRVLPELTDEWVEENINGADTVDELKAALDGQARQQAYQRYVAEARDKAIVEATKRFTGNVSTAIVQFVYGNLVETAKRNVEATGEPFNEYVERIGGRAAFESAMSLQARQAIAQDYTLDAIFRNKKLTIEEQDIYEACASMNANNPAAARAELERTGRGFTLREIASRYAASRWLVETATLMIPKKDVKAE